MPRTELEIDKVPSIARTDYKGRGMLNGHQHKNLDH